MKVCVILCVIGRIQAKMEAPGVRGHLSPTPPSGAGGTPGAAARGEVN